MYQIFPERCGSQTHRPKFATMVFENICKGHQSCYIMQTSQQKNSQPIKNEKPPEYSSVLLCLLITCTQKLLPPLYWNRRITPFLHSICLKNILIPENFLGHLLNLTSISSPDLNCKTTFLGIAFAYFSQNAKGTI